MIEKMPDKLKLIVNIYLKMNIFEIVLYSYIMTELNTITFPINYTSNFKPN